MALIPWKGKRENGGHRSALTGFRNEMDQLFDTFFNEPFGWLGDRAGFGWNPSVDVEEGEKEITVRAEVPGVSADDINLTISGNTLSIAGEKKEEHETNEQGYYHRERRFGSFRRDVPLPAAVDASRITADFAHGVLTVKMEKSPEAVSKRIPVQAK